MSKAALQQEPELPVPIAALFIAFLTVSLCGFGGGLVWAHRIAVEQRRWTSEQEFADIVSLCQFMPGPNMVGIAVCVGAKLRGCIGAAAALCGFIADSVGNWFLAWCAIPRIRSPDGSAKYTRRGFRHGSRAAHRDWNKVADAASRPSDRRVLCRARLRSDGVQQAAASCGAVRTRAAEHCRRRIRQRENTMSRPSALIALTAHLALLSSISFGGFPTVLPDVRNFVVVTHGWMTDQEFANFFAMAQAIPGPNMILMMSFVGWKVWGIPGAVASALATFGPPCAMYFVAYRLWGRFRDAPWQRIVRSGLVPVTIGLVIASGTVMARAADPDWQAAAMTIAAVVLMLGTRLNPLWILLAGAALGGLGLL